MGAMQQALLGVGGAAAASWRTLIDWTADTTGTNTGWNGYTMRHLYKVAASAGYAGLGSGGTKIRIQLRGGQTTGLAINNAYVGVAAASGDLYDFETTPTQILWSGSSSVSVGALTNTALSDETLFTFDGSKALIIALHFNGASNLLTTVDGNPGSAGATQYYQAATDSSATVNASSGQASTLAYAISKVDIYG